MQKELLSKFQDFVALDNDARARYLNLLVDSALAATAPEALAGELPRVGLITYPQVEKLTNRSRTTLWRMVRAKKFPAPIALGGIKVFRRQDLITWLNDFA